MQNNIREMPRGLSSSADMISVVVASFGLMRVSVKLPEDSYDSICRIAEAAGEDPIDHIAEMAKRCYESSDTESIQTSKDSLSCM